MTNAEITLPGEPDVTVVVRRSARARRMSLRVSRLDGRVTLTLPMHASDDSAHDFVAEKAAWIRGHLSTLPRAVPVAPGARLPVEGRIMEVVPGPQTRLSAGNGLIEVRGRADRAGAAVGGLLKALARERLTAASDRHARRLDRPYRRITLRDTRSRWGSCSAEGALMYSWRLILAPPAVLDYVAAHEVAHLAEMNHSPRYWAVVKQLCPDYETHRRWLRRHGEHLHRYRFGPG